MKLYEASALIHAPSERIWALLTDAAGYPGWNPTVDRVEGTIVLGGKLKVYPKLSPGRGFGVKVKELVPNHRMVWSGGMPLGLFKGERTYTLAPQGDAHAFTMREELSGPMAGLITRSIPDMQPAFDEFAAALKRRAEQA